MNIQLAYCVEMKQTVDIFQARNFYFSRRFRKDLNFLCFDETCRKMSKPVVIGINYRKLSDQGDDIINRLHFRGHYQFSHHYSCPELEYEEARQTVEFEENSDNQRRHAKKSDVVDIFTPYTQDACDMGLGEDKPYEIVRKIVRRDDRVKALSNYIRNAKTRSGLLQEVITSFENLSNDAKRITLLEINGNRKTYFALFKHILDYADHPGSIFFGGASVKKYIKGNCLLGYVIRFYDPIVFEGSTQKVSIFISQNHLRDYKYGDFLEKQLIAAGQEGFYTKCYFWGEIMTGNWEGTLKVNIEHLNNLHLAVIPKKALRLL